MKEREVAVRAAKKAGKVLIENYGKVGFRRDIKDVFSEIDKKSERVIIKEISKKFPDHTIISEESDLEKKNSEYEWYIDPVDGTTSYVNRIPSFSISIGLVKKGEPILGVIYNPLYLELFVAEKDKGAYINGKKLKVDDTKELSESFLATDLGHENKKKVIPYFTKTVPNVSYIYIFGSACIGLSYLADARIQGYFHNDLKPWDIAAGVLLVEEAGGRVTDLKGNKWNINKPDILATNGFIHEKLLNMLYQ